MVGNPRDDSGEDFDGLAALDVYAGRQADAYGAELAALDDYPPPRPLPDDTVLDDGEERPFTVTNPPGTVTVSAYPDGRIERIELSPGAAKMSERELAEEIVVIAGLAAQDAKSAQYETMLAGMRAHGHDDLATREFLQRDLDLPTPEQAQARRAEVFTTRYAGSHE
jgi:hypothetical protein